MNISELFNRRKNMFYQYWQDTYDIGPISQPTSNISQQGQAQQGQVQPSQSQGQPSRSQGQPGQSQGQPSQSQGQPSQSQGQGEQSLGQPNQRNVEPVKPPPPPPKPPIDDTIISSLTGLTILDFFTNNKGKIEYDSKSKTHMVPTEKNMEWTALKTFIYSPQVAKYIEKCKQIEPAKLQVLVKDVYLKNINILLKELEKFIDDAIILGLTGLTILDFFSSDKAKLEYESKSKTHIVPAEKEKEWTALKKFIESKDVMTKYIEKCKLIDDTKLQALVKDVYQTDINSLFSELGKQDELFVENMLKSFKFNLNSLYNSIKSTVKLKDDFVTDVVKVFIPEPIGELNSDNIVEKLINNLPDEYFKRKLGNKTGDLYESFDINFFSKVKSGLEKKEFVDARANFIDMKIGSARVIVAVNNKYFFEDDGTNNSQNENKFLVTGPSDNNTDCKPENCIHNMLYIPLKSVCKTEIKYTSNDLADISSKQLFTGNAEEAKTNPNNLVIYNGPFNEVYSPEIIYPEKQGFGYDTKVIFDNSFKQAMDKLKNYKSVIVFGFGFSGSGKTYQLVDSAKNNVSEGEGEGKKPNTILYHILSDMEKITPGAKQAGIIGINFSITELYPYEEDIFEKTYSSGETTKINGDYYYLRNDLPVSPGKQIPELNRYSIQQEGDDRENFLGKLNTFLLEDFVKIDQRVKLYRYNTMRISPTPNNRESSRGHLFYEFEFKWSNGKKNKFCIIDMAGTENTIEIKKAFFGTVEGSPLKNINQRGSTKSDEMNGWDNVYEAINVDKDFPYIGKGDEFSVFLHTRSGKDGKNGLVLTKIVKAFGLEASSDYKLPTDVKPKPSETLIWKKLNGNLPTQSELTASISKIFVDFNVIYNGLESKDDFTEKHTFLTFVDNDKKNEPKNKEYSNILSGKLDKFFTNMIGDPDVPTGNADTSDAPPGDDATQLKVGKKIEAKLLLDKIKTPEEKSDYFTQLQNSVNSSDDKFFVNQIVETYKMFIGEDVSNINERNPDATIFGWIEGFNSENFKAYLNDFVKDDHVDYEINKICVSCVYIFYKFIFRIRKETIMKAGKGTKEVVGALGQDGNKLKRLFKMAFMYRYTQIVVNQGRGIVTSLEHIKYYFLYKSPGQERLTDYNNNGKSVTIPDSSNIGYNYNYDKSSIGMGDLMDKSVKYKINSSKMVETREMGYMNKIQLIKKMNEIVDADEPELKAENIGNTGKTLVNIGTTTDCLFMMLACILRYEGDIANKDIINKYCNATYNTLKLCQSLSSKPKKFSIVDNIITKIENFLGLKKNKIIRKSKKRVRKKGKKSKRKNKRYS